MMKLDKQTAQAIVKRTMQIIPNAVNVMDEQGIIIASGDPSRVGERHTGAVIVLRSNQAVEIDEKLAKQWNYEAREGLNLPIRYLGNTIGVIGISGAPQAVRHYAELVTMAAELIVEQAIVLETERWQRRYKEEFIRQLLKGSLNKEQTEQQARFFNLNPVQTLAAIIIKLNKPTSEDLQTVLLHLEQQQPNATVVVVGLDKLVLLLPAEELLQRQKQKTLNQLFPSQMAETDYRMVIGCLVEHFVEAHFSYQSALHTLAYAENNHTKKQIICFEDYRLQALLADFSHSWQAKELFTPVQHLISQDEKNVLFKSLQQYFLSNCDLVHASEKLFIHQNTLRYRLERIEQITSLSFNKIEDKFILYLGAILTP
ncbi:carbohydrate diacid transcriptional activator CdaR [Actinobacillus ureae]|nr:carbohydrate diacid transcriptional activator CdaR [Actinobacillus ureae]SUU47473.1 carbohydrate diacid transcriptional activator CdaR [Actinobacillus ureae]